MSYVITSDLDISIRVISHTINEVINHRSFQECQVLHKGSLKLSETGGGNVFGGRSSHSFGYYSNITILRRVGNPQSTAQVIDQFFDLVRTLYIIEKLPNGQCQRKHGLSNVLILQCKKTRRTLVSTVKPNFCVEGNTVLVSISKR